jgi:hypothetical protein
MTPPTIIVALAGLSRAGKDTVAEALQRLIHAAGMKCDIMPLAKQVKEFAESWGWTGAKTPKDRALLEGLTVLREAWDPGGWARDWADARRLTTRGRSVIIAPDYRLDSGFGPLIDAHGDKDGKGFRFTITRETEANWYSFRAPSDMNLRHWDYLARSAGVPIDNSADDAGASAARAILENMKGRGFS